MYTEIDRPVQRRRVRPVAWVVFGAVGAALIVLIVVLAVLRSRTFHLLAYL